jgi:PI-3-kinase-related kinase SMG-1
LWYLPFLCKQIFHHNVVGKEIEETLEKLREPSNPRCPAECWHLLKTLQLKLYARSCKKTAHTLNMEDISPSLAKLKDTRISMPGVMSSQVVIHSVYNYVAILPTKTKPKKLVFIGSNGKL